MLLNKEIWKYKELKNAWKYFLKLTEWETFITFTFKYNHRNFKEAYKMVKSYFYKVKNMFGNIQFGALSIALIDQYNLEGTIHRHSLVYSNPRYPRRFSNLMNNDGIAKLKFLWDDIGMLTIDKVYNNSSACSYTLVPKKRTMC